MSSQAITCSGGRASVVLGPGPRLGLCHRAAIEGSVTGKVTVTIGLEVSLMIMISVM